MKYILSFIILPVLFSNCCLSKKPFSFMDSLNQLQSIELIDEFETYIPDIESTINFVDSLDNLGIIHPHYYGIGIDSELNIAEDVRDNGINISQLQAKLLEKIEELTLYMIEMKKENELLKQEINKLK